MVGRVVRWCAITPKRPTTATSSRTRSVTPASPSNARCSLSRRRVPAAATVCPANPVTTSKRKKKVHRKQRPKAKLTLEQVVTAAVEAGASVSISLPKLLPMPPERPRLKVPTKDWPGSPYNRSTMADMNYTEKDVARVFKDNPSSLWVITPYEIVSREEFFKPKRAPRQGTGTNPSWPPSN